MKETSLLLPLVHPKRKAWSNIQDGEPHPLDAGSLYLGVSSLWILVPATTAILAPVEQASCGMTTLVSLLRIASFVLSAISAFSSLLMWYDWSVFRMNMDRLSATAFLACSALFAWARGGWQRECTIVLGLLTLAAYFSRQPLWDYMPFPHMFFR